MITYIRTESEVLSSLANARYKADSQKLAVVASCTHENSGCMDFGKSIATRFDGRFFKLISSFGYEEMWEETNEGVVELTHNSSKKGSVDTVLFTAVA